MTFELLPTIDIMIDLYKQPSNFERFKTYLETLQGGKKGDLAFPITGFNPMAKEHLPDKLVELKKLGAEEIIEETLKDLNDKFISKNPKRNFKVAINLSDDLKGGWTNRFTSDYDSKFKFNGLITRDFCTPVFWASENFTKDQIKKRTLEYVFRTIYWLTCPKPKTLKEHVEQESYVAGEVNFNNQIPKKIFALIDRFYKENQNSENYHLIFNFFYGDKASESLAFPTFGVIENCTGFEYASQSSDECK